MPRGDEPEPMEVAAEPERRAVAEPAPRQQLGPLAGMPVEMAAQPRLALDEERRGRVAPGPPSRAGPAPER